jgi:uncharacterized repeat protein (TIGR03803 family)
MRLATQSRIAVILLALACFPTPSVAQYTQTVLHTFTPGKDGANINFDPVLPDAAGNLYGTTSGGGDYNSGSLYELTPAPGHTWRETQLYSFKTHSLEVGASPSGSIVRDAAGNFYGIAPTDGLANCYDQGFPVGCGAIWQLTKTSGTWKHTLIYSFTGGADGANPASLIIDGSGNLYGVTGTTVFELSRSAGSWSLKTLYTFTGGSDGAQPNAVLLDGSGNLLGATYYGGVGECYIYGGGSGCGVVFKLSPSSGGAWTESTVYSFLGGNDGGQPIGSLALDQYGDVFGVAGVGGAYANGVVFEVDPGSNSETVPYAFTNIVYPANISSDAAGNFYVTTYQGGLLNNCQNGCGTILELSKAEGGWNATTVYSFSGGWDGSSTGSAPVFDPKGNLYVSTLARVESTTILFELTPAAPGKWRGSVAHNFPSNVGGNSPLAGVIRDAAGNLYGTTVQGGAYGWGNVFELTPSGSTWKETVLHNFDGMDGAYPVAALTLDSAGNLYGTAEYGGSTFCGYGCGTVFKLSPGSGGSWNFSVLHSFKNGKDGNYPRGGVVIDAAGNLYGTSMNSTNNADCVYGCGTVFELSPSNGGEWNFKLLYAFQGNASGGGPADGTIAIDPAGNLYGTTAEGGVGYGTLYQISPPTSGGAWTPSVLYTFSQTDQYSAGTLVLDPAGNIYGTTERGGPSNLGTVYELAHSAGAWTKNTLYSFTGNGDGEIPTAGVVFDGAGNLYGMTRLGVYELSPATGSWTEKTLFTFDTSQDPTTSLVLDPNGNIFTTFNMDAVYELTP